MKLNILNLFGIQRKNHTRMSVRNAVMRQNLYPLTFGGKKYFRSDLGIEFKSSWEANYYRLMKQTCPDVKISYEPKTFHFPKNASPYGICSYIPDFEISWGKHLYYVEIKGRMDKASAEKIRLFKKYYPRLRLYIVGPRSYSLIKKYYSEKIKGWE